MLYFIAIYRYWSIEKWLLHKYFQCLPSLQEPETVLVLGSTDSSISTARPTGRNKSKKLLNWHTKIHQLHSRVITCNYQMQSTFMYCVDYVFTMYWFRIRNQTLAGSLPLCPVVSFWLEESNRRQRLGAWETTRSTVSPWFLPHILRQPTQATQLHAIVSNPLSSAEY